MCIRGLRGLGATASIVTPFHWRSNATRRVHINNQSTHTHIIDLTKSNPAKSKHIWKDDGDGDDFITPAFSYHASK